MRPFDHRRPRLPYRFQPFKHLRRYHHRPVGLIFCRHSVSLVSAMPDHPFEKAYEVLLFSSLHGALPRFAHRGYGLVGGVAAERDEDAGGECAGTSEAAAAVGNDVLTTL